MSDYASILAKVVGLTSAGIFAGFTWSLSLTCIPSILYYGSKSEVSVLTQWRSLYVDGSQLAQPCSIIAALSFSYLAYAAHPSSSNRLLFIIAAVCNASGVPYALTVLRRTNGALSIRAKKLAGNYRKAGESGGEPIACTYANNDQRCILREKDPAWTTKRLIERWKWHNNIRTAILSFGTVIGAYAAIIDERF